MPQVLILGVIGLAVDLQRDVVRLSVLDLLFTGLDIPLTPRGDDGHAGCEVLDRQLETNLIVALAGATVADGVGAFLERDLDQTLGDAGAGVAGAEQILFIHRPRLDAGDDEIVNVLLGEVQHVQLGSAGLECLFLQALQFVCLTDVTGHGDDLAVVVVLFQPRDDDGGIQTARVGEHDLFDVFFVHVYASSLNEYSLNLSNMHTLYTFNRGLSSGYSYLCNKIGTLYNYSYRAAGGTGQNGRKILADAVRIC